MRRFASAFFISLSFAILCNSGGAIDMDAQTPPAATVTLSPGDNIQVAVNRAPPGTTFVLEAGTYRGQSVEPKNDDSFVGHGTVILNGSQVLTFLRDPTGSGVWISSAVADKFNPGSCQKEYPLCAYTQDMFMDDIPQTPASTLQSMRKGSWYFDRIHNEVYLPVNPSGHQIELGMLQYAFHGNASGVQITDLVIEKYATPAQAGAIGGNSSATDWTVNRVEARWNHGRGISLGPGSQILNSSVHHNGQLGISLSGAFAKAIGNDISWNNYAGYNTGWEAGGTKFWATTNLMVQSNNVHDNNGPGLWTDFNNVGTHYESNTVTNNTGEGIKHEISYNAIIRYNVVKGNGRIPTVWLWNAQIEVQNSSYVQVYGNTVEVPVGGGNGIAVINQKRGTGKLGPWVAANNHVHDNTITHLGDNGASGLVDDTGGNTAVGNRFDTDRYILPNTGKKHWVWFTAKDWAEFRAVGEEADGICCN